MPLEIDEQRQPWESDEHWVFRKEFLLAHQGKFTDDRLLCLAQVFANIELLGCSYPSAVTGQINELAKDISCLDSIREKRLDKATVKFVKASDDKQGNKRSGDQDSFPNRQKFSRSEGQYNSRNNRPGARPNSSGFR